MAARCPVCEGELGLKRPSDSGDWEAFDCLNCGRFRIGADALAEKPRAWTVSQRARAVLSHAISRMQRPSDWPLLTVEVIQTVLRDDVLPTPTEQVRLLITHLAETLTDPGQTTNIHFLNDRALLGAQSPQGVSFVLGAARDKALVWSVESVDHAVPVRLTFEGWSEAERLRGEAPDSRIAFMAMQYGDANVDEAFMTIFQPAVAQTGFDLLRLDLHPRAGIIDVRLRVEIRRARFLLSDLTNGNPGAYWEAGFAEGLGRPVIYTCEREAFKRAKTHFDTNHSHHIRWDLTKPNDALDELKATIRATMPSEAKLED